jgi:hypothetical protein
MTSKPRRRTRYDTDATRLVGAGVDASDPRPHLVCLGCDKRHIIDLPMDVTMFVATTKAFVKIHRLCRAPISPLDTPVSPEAGAQGPEAVCAMPLSSPPEQP